MGITLVATTAVSAMAASAHPEKNHGVVAPTTFLQATDPTNDAIAIGTAQTRTLAVSAKVAPASAARESVSVVRAPHAVWPVGAGATISDGFGARTAPTAGASTNHQGVDFAPGYGTPVVAAATGVVREAITTDQGGCGIQIRIDHQVRGEAFTTVYCHLAPGSVRVAPGQSVGVGTQIAAVGNTGVSTGAHLHFEVRPNGGAAVDPIAWLNARVGS